MASDRTRELLSYNLRKLRKEKNLSQEELAEKVNITRKTISLYERCSSFPSSEKLEAFADALGVSIADLFREEGESPKYDYRFSDAAIDDAVQVIKERLKRYTREHEPRK